MDSCGQDGGVGSEKAQGAEMTHTGAKTAFPSENRRGGDSNPRYGRIPVRRFSKPLPVNGKGIHHNNLQEASEKTATKTAQICADLPEDLQVLIRKLMASWENMPGHIKATMMSLPDLHK